MASSPYYLLLIFTLLSFSLLSTSTDVHDILPRFGLPKGLLPDKVKSFTLSNDGAFTVDFETHCYVHFDDQLVYYSNKIAGKLTYGSVRDVVGIQAKKLFVWVPVSAMVSNPDSGMIEVFVGFVSEKLPVDRFLNVPVCKNKAFNLVDYVM